MEFVLWHLTGLGFDTDFGIDGEITNVNHFLPSDVGSIVTIPGTRISRRIFMDKITVVVREGSVAQSRSGCLTSAHALIYGEARERNGGTWHTQH